jgi:hypothetical protein
VESRDPKAPLRGHNVRYGFVLKKVPHITLGSIANNEPPDEETLYDRPLTGRLLDVIDEVERERQGARRDEDAKNLGLHCQNPPRSDMATLRAAVQVACEGMKTLFAANEFHSNHQGLAAGGTISSRPHRSARSL